MKLQPNVHTPKNSFRSGVLLLVVSCSCLAFSQEAGSNSSPFTISSRVQAPEVARAQCKSDVSCFDAGSYLAIVTDILEGDVPSYRKARLAVRFENLTNETVVLAYRAGSALMVDNFKNRYSCCQTDSSKEDVSATGIGIDREDKINPQFRLKPRTSDTVIFELWRHRTSDEPASYYHFEVMIDELDPSGKVVLRHPVLFFKNLPATAPEADQRK